MQTELDPAPSTPSAEALREQANEARPSCSTGAPTPLLKRTRTRRGEAAAWRRAHFPQIYAFLRGDMKTFYEVEARRTALEEIFAERAVFCVYCHALMIHQMAGFYACPYERARVHDHARAALRL